MLRVCWCSEFTQYLVLVKFADSVPKVSDEPCKSSPVHGNCVNKHHHRAVKQPLAITSCIYRNGLLLIYFQENHLPSQTSTRACRLLYTPMPSFHCCRNVSQCVLLSRYTQTQSNVINFVEWILIGLSSLR